MTDATINPSPYRVVYSGWVQDELRVMSKRAAASGAARPFVEALSAIDYRLRVYPQFGDPLRDIQIEPGHYRIAIVPPLVVKYLVYEERRLVLVVTPIQTLANAGFRSERSIGNERRPKKNQPAANAGYDRGAVRRFTPDSCQGIISANGGE